MASLLKRYSVIVLLVLGMAVLSALLFVKGDEVAAMWEECREKTSRDKTFCYQTRLEAILKTRGTEQALTAIEELAKKDPDVLRDAHPYVHHLGRISFSHYKDAPTAFSHCKDTFWSGCYHGVLEGYLSSLSQVKPQHITTLCSDNIDAGQSLVLKYQCVHGLGHGLTMHFQHEVPKALSFCDALPTDWDRESCYGGVFMENIVAFQNPHHRHHTGHQSFLNPQDPLYPCNVVEKKYQLACYLMQTSAILTFNGYNFAQAFRECDKAPPEFIPICYQSLGRDISGFTLRDGERTLGLCQLGGPEYRHHCFVGAVKDFILTHADPERGLAFCRQLEAAYKKDCYAAVGEILVSLYPDQERRDKACAGAEKEYTAVCKALARSS